MYFPIKNPDDQNQYPVAPDGSEGRWRIGKKRMDLTIDNNNIHWEKNNDKWIPYEKVYYNGDDIKVIKTRSIFLDSGETGDGTKKLIEIFGKKDLFQNPKPVELICELLSHAKNDTILDFFAGSGTTGHAVMELNKVDAARGAGGKRNFILCTNNENNICYDITYQRIKKAIEKENYSDSLKYYKIEFIPINDRLYYEYSDELLKHIRELVELENAINFSGNKNVAIILKEEELYDFIKNIKKHKYCCKIYRAHNLLISSKQAQALKTAGIKIYVIPDYYYGDLVT